MLKGDVKAFRVALAALGLCLAGSASSAPVVLSGVPAYNWYHGCGPTAAASILGYWDHMGYSNLFDAEGADLLYTWEVQNQISSLEHNAKFDPTPDDPNLPDPTDNSIADWFKTSEDHDGYTMGYGWSHLGDSPAAFTGYGAYRGYTIDSWWESASDNFAWSDLVGQIDAGRPVMFLVDTDGSGATDHFIPVFGYEDRGTAGLWYACYTTWHEDETVDWFQFAPMASGTDWGVGYATYVIPESVPEPATLAALGIGVAMVVRRRRKA